MLLSSLTLVAGLALCPSASALRFSPGIDPGPSTILEPFGFAVSKVAAGPKVYWKGESFRTGDLPAELPEGTRAGIEYWAPWAEEMNYVLQLADSADFMMLTRKRKLSSKEWARAVEPALTLTDTLAPLPDRQQKASETGTTEAGTDDEMTWSWGEVLELEYDLACFFQLKNSDHMRSLLEFVAKKEEKQPGWKTPYENLPGLILHKPLTGVIVESAPGVEEWDPLNEMVNRIARMMIIRRYGKVPFWLSLGIAWKVELDVRGNLFCFPHRTNFVGVSEHNGFRDSLKKQFRKKNGPVMDMNQLASWQRGTYDATQAARAWGTVSYIEVFKPEALSAILEDMRLLTERKGRINNPDGTWDLIPNFQPSPQDQTEVLERHLGASFLEDVSYYFYKGMKKPSARRKP